MSTFRHLVPISLTVLTLSLAACDKKADDKKADDKKADGDKADGDKADGDKADDKADDKKTPPPVPELAEQDLSEKAKEFIPGFTGKLTAKIPAGAEVGEGMGGLDIKAEGFGMSIMVGSYSAEDIKKRVEAGDDPLDNEKLVDSGEGFVLYEGDAFGEHGFHIQVDLPPIGGLVAGCSTPMAQGFPEAHARKIIEACQSVTLGK